MIYVCNVCGLVIKVSDPTSPYAGPLSEEKFLPCVNESCGGKLVDAALLPSWARDEEGLANEAKEFTSEQLFKAAKGFGLPQERMAPDTVIDLLKKHKVVEVVGQEAGKLPRLVIDKLVLEGGWALHFAPSMYGATVYKVTHE